MSKFKLACLFISLYITCLVLFFVPTFAITVIAIVLVVGYTAIYTVASSIGWLMGKTINVVIDTAFGPFADTQEN